MPIAMLLLSVVAAAVSGLAVWSVAGFWWALVAYSCAGATTLLALAALQAFPLPPEPARQFGKAGAAR